MTLDEQNKSQRKTPKKATATAKPKPKPRSLRKNDNVRVVSGVAKDREGKVKMITPDNPPELRYFVEGTQVLGRFSSAELERV